MAIVKQNLDLVTKDLVIVSILPASKMLGKRVLVFVVMILQTIAEKYTKDKTIQKIKTKTCSRFCFLNSNCHESFSRREGFKVGHVQFIRFKGKEYQIVTRSMRPLMFEIPDFLSDTECDHIVRLAQQKGLETSKTLTDDSVPASPLIINITISRYKRIGRRFENHLASVEKLTEFVNQAEALYPRKTDAEKMFKMFDSNKDNNITGEELFLAPNDVMRSFYNCLKEYKMKPLYRSRYSSQTWLPMAEKRLRELQEKMAKAINLPKHIVESSEELQVVYYSVDGHFHGHYDSTEDAIGRDLPCCNQQDEDEDPKTCHLCRYMTILVFLNNVTRGGETVFPVADAERVHLNQSSNFSLHCHNANIIMKPRKGTAIMWYNHHLDPKTGLLGAMDVYSFHGGCDVMEGSKWIATRWINIPK